MLSNGCKTERRCRNLSACDYGGSDLIAARAALTARRADIENVRTRFKAGTASLAAGPISSIASIVLMSR